MARCEVCGHEGEGAGDGCAACGTPWARASTAGAATPKVEGAAGSPRPGGTLVQTPAERAKLATRGLPELSAEFTERYELVRKLGEGGMGVVYLAVQKRFGREVAIKFMLFEDGAMRERFEREGRLLARLSHPNVVQVFDMGEEGGRPYLVQEYVKGESLEARLEREKVLGAAEALRLGREVAAGLAEAHREGILHRDVKPANVLLTGKGTAKLADFGLGREVGGEKKTRVGAVLGTPGYMSPEVALGGEATVASDVYALGVMLYEMLAGRLPYEAADRASYLRLQMTRDAEPVSFHVEDLPAGTDEVVSRCLARNPSERPATAAEVEETLERLAKRAGLARTARAARGGAAGSARPPAAADARDPSHDPSHNPSRERERAEATSAPGSVKGRGGTARPRTGTVLEGTSEGRRAAGTPVSPRAATPLAGTAAVRPGGPSGVAPAPSSGLPGGVWPWVVTGMVVAATVGGLAVHWVSPTPGRVEAGGVGPTGSTTAVAAGTAVGAATVGPTPRATSVPDPNRSRERAGLSTATSLPTAPTAPTTGTVIVESVPPGASVVDQATGRELGLTPYRRSSVPAGTWDFTLVLPGHRDKPMTAKVEAGRLKRVEATLEPVIPPTAPDPSRTRQRAVSPESGPATKWVNAKDGSVMLRIEGGTFQMGSNEGESDEKPVHPVTLSAYSIGKHEVTWGQYGRFCGETGRSQPSDPGFAHDDTHPVVLVSWEDAKAYCAWAGLRLPTEAEWEYAARGADGRKYPWGSEEPNAGGTYRANYDPGNYSEDGFEKTAPVQSFANGASPFGCLNMAGNVWEWCSDWYGSYPEGTVTDPTGPSDGSYRVFRGGSWSTRAVNVRSAFRNGDVPGTRYAYLGFRPARSLP